MMVRLRADPVDRNVVVVYMPISAHVGEKVEKIYEQIEDKMEGLRNREYTILLGDMNAVVGKKSDSMVVRNHGLETRNERDKLLNDFCQRNKLCIMNTWFKQPKRRVYAWKASRDCNRYQLDYIIVQNRYKNSVKNAHAYSRADVKSYDKMVMIKVRLILKRSHRKKQRVL